jgi:hypothetical protein
MGGIRLRMMVPKAWEIVVKKNVLHVACHYISISARETKMSQKISRTSSRLTNGIQLAPKLSRKGNVNNQEQ